MGVASGGGDRGGSTAKVIAGRKVKRYEIIEAVLALTLEDLEKLVWPRRRYTE